jgi:hypothetical protein
VQKGVTLPLSAYLTVFLVAPSHKQKAALVSNATKVICKVSELEGKPSKLKAWGYLEIIQTGVKGVDPKKLISEF